VDAQLLRNQGNALPVRQTQPPSEISLDHLAVTTRRIAPSSHLQKIQRGGEASTVLAEGGQHSNRMTFSGCGMLSSNQYTLLKHGHKANTAQLVFLHKQST
jgi:hypothetical protein